MGRGQLAKKWDCTGYPGRRLQSPPRGAWNTMGPARLGNSTQQAVSFQESSCGVAGWGELAGDWSKGSEMPFGNSPEAPQETHRAQERPGRTQEVEVRRQRKFLCDFW